MDYKGYKASLWVDEKSELICGKVSNISNASLPFKGKNFEEAKKEFIKTIDTYLEFCKSENIEPQKPESFSGKLPFRTSAEIHQKISQTARQRGKSINSWLEEAAVKALQEDSAEEEQDEDFPSELIRRLKKHPEMRDHFVEEVTPFLKDQGPFGAIELLSAVEKSLPGLEAIRACLKNPDAKTMTQVMGAIERWLKIALVDGDIPSHTLKVTRKLSRKSG